MKILTISDSFKGTLSSTEIGKMVSDHFKKQSHETKYVPISDGGEGFLDVISFIKNLKPYQIKVNGPYFHETVARYIFDDKEQVAYLELAEASGITKEPKEKLRAPFASTYGLGELMVHVIKNHKPKKIVMGIGGSATTDVGAGMLEAMGVEFIDQKGFRVNRVANFNLLQAQKLNVRAFNRLIKGIEFVTLSDVLNPLVGDLGTVRVFSPQKGAQVSDFLVMDKNINHFVNLSKVALKKDVPDFEGAGAAGGVGFAMKHFFNSKIVSGIDEILNLVDFDHLAKEYDVVITGEGKFDSQSLNGKVISGIKKHNPKRLIILCGSKAIESNEEVYSIVPNVATLEDALTKPQESFKKLLDNIKL